MALNPRQQFFVVEYLVDRNATQAAIRAGYSKKTAGAQGEQLLKNPEIRTAVQEGLNAREERTKVNADYVLHVIVDTIERCRQNRPVLDRQGNPVMTETPNGQIVPAYAFDANGVLRGAELLGKHLKLFSDRIEIEVSEKPKSLNDFYGNIIDGEATTDA